MALPPPTPSPESTPEPTFPLKARGRWRGADRDAIAVNPGAWSGQVWLVRVDDCHDPVLYAVEAATPAAAEEAFVDSGADPSVRITPDSPEADDYGTVTQDEVRVLNTVVTAKTWTTCSGRTITDAAVGRFLLEPQVTGAGVVYDGQSILIDGRECVDLPWPCRYHGPDLPAGGVDPRSYARAAACEGCGATYYPATRADTYGFCSPACALRVLDDEDNT